MGTLPLIAGMRRFAQRARDREAIQPRQHDIQHDQVRFFLVQHMQRQRAVVRLDHPEAFKLKVTAHDFTHGRFIIYHENSLLSSHGGDYTKLSLRKNYDKGRMFDDPVHGLSESLNVGEILV